jgi:hypothetical protein
MDVDDSDTDDASHCRKFIQNVERMDLDENSDPDRCGADVSYVSNGSTLIAQSPAGESVLKRCSRHKCVEGTVKKSGVLVVFDVNPKTGNKYAKCRSCMKDGDESNSKVCLPHHLSQHSQSNAPINCSECHPLVAVGGDFEENLGLNFLFIDTN